jgi:hypothetical protein
MNDKIWTGERADSIAGETKEKARPSRMLQIVGLRYFLYSFLFAATTLANIFAASWI